MSTDNHILNAPIDVSVECERMANTHFQAGALTAFDGSRGAGLLQWNRHDRHFRLNFNRGHLPFRKSEKITFPADTEQDPCLPFGISFISDKVVRLRWSAYKDVVRDDAESLMLASLPGVSTAWTIREDSELRIVWEGPGGSVIMHKDPWHLEIRDPQGRLLTGTQQGRCPQPFSIVSRAADVERQFSAAFSLSHDEKVYGCGESFTRLNKRGQKVVLCTKDPGGVQTQEMYKPVPFFMSSRGYGMFVHSSTPMTFDFGHDHDATTLLHVGDDMLDVFLFLGTPKEILADYTALTGRSPLPPLWSFGLWMSRITYKDETEVREVATTLRDQQIPCDVIHIDTGWFETDWQCDFEFSRKRFDPEKMMADLREQVFRICLWQYPYLTSANKLYREAVDKRYIVSNSKGHYAMDDVVLDFSNPDAVRWYQGLLADLLRKGVGAIKADFGEAAPQDGFYASGNSGWYEHNLYPLRYNKAVADVTREVTGEHIIWARSAWAGSQRYPLHWGGDAENTDSGMAASLRGGLSLGLCGFSFWSHDIGGFWNSSPEALYRRWLPFGLLSSHSRCHGAPPTEPWHYGEDFTNAFRRAVELRYRLMPYIYTQAKISSEHGWPMVRTLFFEYPDDPTAWLIEDQYFLGHDLLVAPLMDEAPERTVYLPAGTWIDYQTATVYAGAQWHTITSGPIPCILLVRDGSMLPHVALAQNTGAIDWNSIECNVFASEADTAEGELYTPQAEHLQHVKLTRTETGFAFAAEHPNTWSLSRDGGVSP